MPDPKPAPTPREAGRAAVARKGRGKCQVCGREIALRQDGMPKAAHNREILHNPDAAPDDQVKSWLECHGSRLPPAEYVEAFEAARNVSTGAPVASGTKGPTSPKD